MTDIQGNGPPMPEDPYAPASNVLRAPPHDIQLEQEVLSACMNYDVIADVAEIVSGRDMYHQAHLQIFAAMMDLYEDGDAIDYFTVRETLKQHGSWDAIGGDVYLSLVSATAMTGVNAPRHARILKDYSTKRAAITLGAELSSGAYDLQQDTSDLLQQTDEKLLRLVMGQGRTGGFRVMADIHSDLMGLIDENKARGTALAGLRTGFPSIDEATGGWENGDLIIIAARPGEAKTSLLLQEARFVSYLNQCPGAFFSLEMNETQLGARQIAEYCSIDSLRVKTGSMSDEEFQRMTDGMGHLSGLRLYIDDTPGLSIMECRARSRRLKKEHGLGFVMIDYLQLMTATDQRSREQEVAKVSRGLKGLAKELDVPVLAAAQLSRATEGRADRRPVLADLRESGAIEQDADIVCFIYHPSKAGIKGRDGEDLTGLVELIFAKQRNAPTQSIKMRWEEKTTSFRDPKWAKREMVGGELGRFYF